MKKTELIILVVSFLLTSCAKLRHSPRWPAVIQSINGFETTEENDLRKSLTDLEERTGQKGLILQNGESGLAIHIIKKAPPDDMPLRAGLAIVESTQCIIEISPRVFEQYPAYVKSVIWHEMGHCAGLEHTGDPGEIMYRSSQRFDLYSNEAIERFFRALLPQE